MCMWDVSILSLQCSTTCVGCAMYVWYVRMLLVVLCPAEAVVSLKQTLHICDEDVGKVEICAVVISPSIDCPITFEFNLSLSTTDDTAGITNTSVCVYV